MPLEPTGSAKPPSGTKSDHLDAWSFADALRLDGSHWKPLSKQDPLLEQLRLLESQLEDYRRQIEKLFARAPRS